MNWLLFSILAWIALGMEVGLRDAFQIGHTPLAPSFVMILIVFVALWARPLTLLAAACILGALLDLVNQVNTTHGESVVVLGPWALGSMLAAYTVLNFRAMMFRRNPITAAILCVLAGAIAAAVVVVLLRIRAQYDDIQVASAAAELLPRLGAALYTGLVAVPFIWLLNRLGGPLGFRRPMEAAGRRH